MKTKQKEQKDTNLPVIKSHSGRYRLIMDKHSDNKKKGIWGVFWTFSFFAFIAPFLSGYSIWRPITLINVYNEKQTNEIFWVSVFCFMIFFNVKVIEELIYSRTLLLISQVMLDICMVPVSVFLFSVGFDVGNHIYKMNGGNELDVETRKYFGYGIILLGSMMYLFGLYRGTHCSVKQYYLPTNKKLKRKIRFAHISDVHIGSRLDKLPTKIVHKIIAEKPDFVVITGDLVDSHNIVSSDLQQFELLRKCDIPVYYTIGNHDIMAGEEYVRSILNHYGITYLSNEVQLVDMKGEQLQLVGIDDVQSVNEFNDLFKNVKESIDDEHYSILLHHRPQGYKKVVESGLVDLQLAGHTHNGQLFPLGLITKVFHPKVCGLYTIKSNEKSSNKMHLYTHPGSCAWGPRYRTSGKNLITMFTIEPKH